MSKIHTVKNRVHSIVFVTFVGNVVFLLSPSFSFPFNLYNICFKRYSIEKNETMHSPGTSSPLVRAFRVKRALPRVIWGIKIDLTATETTHTEGYFDAFRGLAQRYD